MRAEEIARRLAGLPPADVPAVRLLLELQGETDVEAVVARRKEIEAACVELEKQIGAAKGLAERCQGLRPIPSKQVPVGF
jgi:hypothetical protein